MSDHEEDVAEGTLARATPDQVLNAGGVSKRRRNLSNRRRSPSGTRTRRAQTPEPGKMADDDDDEDAAARQPTKTPRSKSKTRTEDEVRTVTRSRPKSGVDDEEKTTVRLRSRSKSGIDDEEKTTVTLRSRPKQGVEDADDAPVRTLRRRPKAVSTDQEDVPVKTARSKSKTRSLSLTDDAAPIEPEPDVDVITASLTISPSEVNETVTQAPAAPAEPETPAAEITKPEVNPEVDIKPEVKPEVVAKRWAAWWPFLKDIRGQWALFRAENRDQYMKLRVQSNRCFASLFLVMLYCGVGGLIFRFTEGAFESFYKCGVKRVKRDFIDSLWDGSQYVPEEKWKSNARRKLMEFEDQLHTAHEAGMTSYSGQRSWSFLNAVVYCLTVVTTIGYGHISPSTTTGRAITIIYAIFGIPMFLILLTDFGKLFTRGIKFLWAFVRRLYYTGSCRKVRRTGPVQDVMKGVQIVYNFATNRRPSQMVPGENVADVDGLETMEAHNVPNPPLHQDTLAAPDGTSTVPGTPAPSTFEVDDEFNLPISVAIVVLLIYIFVGATMYYIWETWGFFESFYFVFISMSTIGFGDFVPQHPMYMMASIIYLVFGLALTSMCINVVQEKLSASFQQASAKIGATIGLRMAEEEASLTPMPPPEIELPDVHKPSKPKVT